jgi:DNA-binding LacI/PurR family transcriptional regulator
VAAIILRDSSLVKGARMGRPTLEDVASRAGVSRALVSLVMRGSTRVSVESRRKVLAAADQLGYRPNAMARNLASRRTRTIGLLLNDLHNPWFAEVAEGVEELAAESGYRVLIGSGRGRPKGEEQAVESFLELRTDGIILAGPRLPASRVAAAAAEVPIVVVGRTMRASRVDTVVNDDRLGGKLVVRHLVELGHSAIVHIDGGSGAGARPRRQGYEEGMRESGLSHGIRVVHGDFTDVAGVHAAHRLLQSDEVPTAIFAANDLAAAGVLDRLEDAGLRIPEDVSLVGYDNTFLAALHHISLTTVDQPREAMGRLAMSALLERMEAGRTEPARHVLPPSLVIRRTSGPCPDGARGLPQAARRG